jgi:WD40-like Beta Propeller Repeat
MRGSPWSMSFVSALVVAVIASACGSSGPNRSFAPSGDGGGASSGGGSAGDDGTGDGGFGTFSDTGVSAHDGASSGGQPPKGCDSSCPQAGGTCQNNSCILTENPGGVDSTTIGQLANGGSGDPTFAWQYPYDKTVFPRGLIPPTMQFAGVDPDAMYVHITCASLDYKGYFKPASGPIQLALPAASWTAITNAASGPTDPLVVQVTKIAGGSVAGPITESWPVAQGSLRGIIYYETYGSQLAGGPESVGIMEIQPGAKQPTVLEKGCGHVCHTASADGSTLVASTSLLASASYDLKTSATVINQQANEHYTYGGIYPDGSLEMSATHYRTWINQPSKLYDTATGANIPAAGWDGVIKNAGTTAFSPDGKQLAFVHEDENPRTIAAMDYDNSTKTFSGLVDIASDPSNSLAWPAYTPDGKWVVFQEEPSSSGAPFETDGGNHGDLYFVDIATRTVARLDSLDGYTGAGTTSSYLPANDPQLSFAPTVLPEAVGGYFWIVFTSHRSYGNTLASMAAGADGTADERGQLWVAALDLDPTAGKDASHPAFYLDGQELTADNLRGFWVLPPCEQQGGACTTGDQCCDGFCRPAGDGGPLECVPPPGGCSNEYETCTTSSDCCDSSDTCINNRCAQSSAQ